MSSATRYRLTIRKGPLPGKVYDLAKSVLVLGREVKNDIVINDSEISRQHVRLTEQPSGWQVEDLASTNGAFVNGERISGPRLLKPGDVLGLGETVELEYAAVREAADVTMMAAPDAPPAVETPAPAEAPAPGLFSLPASEPPPAAPPPISEPPPSAAPSSAGPSYSLPPSTPPAPPPQPRSGIPTWAWAVGIGCAVLACCACSAIAAVTFLLPIIQQGSFSP